LTNHDDRVSIDEDPSLIIRPGEGRGLDFVKLTELNKRTGVIAAGVLRFALSEMLANSLDTDAKHIKISLSQCNDFYLLSVGDDGSKVLAEADVRLLFDFANNASSKRGIYRVQRGALGNALKCIFGYSYSIAESLELVPRDILVRSHGVEYIVKLKPDRVREVIDSDIIIASVPDDGYNTFVVGYPNASFTAFVEELVNLITSTSIINPTREVQYDILGNSGSLGEARQSEVLTGYTSVLWYREQEFTALFHDFLRANPRLTLAHFISMFKGYSGRERQAEILQALNAGLDHDSGNAGNPQFLATSPISSLRPKDVKLLYSLMRAGSNPLSPRSVPSSLGMVGKATLEGACANMGWRGVKYGYSTETYAGEVVSFPYLIEVAVFDRATDDIQGLKIYHCVNFMASTEKIFSAIYSVEHHLGLVGIKQDSPVTIVLHLVSPRVEWLNYAKSGMYVEGFNNALKKLLNKVLPIPKTPKLYKQKPPPPPKSWVPRGKIGKPRYEWYLSMFAGEILRIDEGNKRRMKYSPRGWIYILEGLGKIHKGEFPKVGRALTDCRKIGLLPIDFFAEDQDETRRFSALHDALDPRSVLSGAMCQLQETLDGLASQTTDYWRDEKYFVMMCVEKGDIRGLFEPICNEYYIPIVSSKGWSPLRLLDNIVKLSMRAESKGLTPVLLLFYDHDPKGLKITKLFRGKLGEIRRATGWDPKGLIIERVGLNKEDIDKYNLTWIENLKSSSGRESQDAEYISAFGRRKCESNALFRNDETLKAAEDICRHAIEKYYGKDALRRFKDKEKSQRENLVRIYNDPIWKTFDNKIDGIIKTLPEAVTTPEIHTMKISKEVEIDVYIDERYFGSCPRCGADFNYDSSMLNRLMRCRRCYAPMRLRQRLN
jgi:hypothetical protein